MTKKRKRYPDLNQKLERPWCYYCERDFDDLKILISHQKAKHFKCDRCGRRLNTAGGLSVHMNQVHKETLSHVENAISGRQGLEIEIFGMEGVPQEVIDQHNQQVTHKHFEEEQERARISGNPVRGLYTQGAAPPDKRPKVKETVEEIAARAAKYREDKKNGLLPVLPVGAPVEVPPQATPPNVAPFGAPPVTQTPPFAAPGAQTFPPGAFPPGQAFPPGAPGLPQAPYGAARPFPGGPSPVNAPMPPRPGSIPGVPGFPPTAPYGAPPPGFGQVPPPQSAISASVDELIAGASAPEAAPEKKKKEKNIKLVYFDETISPEEKIAALPRFASSVRT